MAIGNAFNRSGGTGSTGEGSFDGTIKEVAFTDQTTPPDFISGGSFAKGFKSFSLILFFL